jgi:hypothetical protein
MERGSRNAPSIRGGYVLKIGQTCRIRPAARPRPARSARIRRRTLTVLDLPSALKLTPSPALPVEYTNPDLPIFLVHADNSAVDPDPEIAECLGFNTVATCCRNPHAHEGSATLGSRLSPALPRVSRPLNLGQPVIFQSSDPHRARLTICPQTDAFASLTGRVHKPRCAHFPGTRRQLCRRSRPRDRRMPRIQHSCNLLPSAVPKPSCP